MYKGDLVTANPVTRRSIVASKTVAPDSCASLIARAGMAHNDGTKGPGSKEDKGW